MTSLLSSWGLMGGPEKARTLRKSAPASPFSARNWPNAGAPRLVLSTTMMDLSEGQAGSARWWSGEVASVGRSAWSVARSGVDLIEGAMKRAEHEVRFSAESNSGPREAGLMHAMMMPVCQSAAGQRSVADASQRQENRTLAVAHCNIAYADPFPKNTPTRSPFFRPIPSRPLASASTYSSIFA